jgi:predicted phosphoribosyltransferase
VGHFYADFPQVPDEEAKELLCSAVRDEAAATPRS